MRDIESVEQYGQSFNFELLCGKTKKWPWCKSDRWQCQGRCKRGRGHLMKNRIPDSIYAVCSEKSDSVYLWGVLYKQWCLSRSVKRLNRLFWAPLTDNEWLTAKKIAIVIMTDTYREWRTAHQYFQKVNRVLLRAWHKFRRRRMMTAAVGNSNNNNQRGGTMICTKLTLI